MEHPTADPEAERLIEVLMMEDESTKEPTDELIDAVADILRTPKYTGFGGEDEEEVKAPDPSGVAIADQTLTKQ